MFAEKMVTTKSFYGYIPDPHTSYLEIRVLKGALLTIIDNVPAIKFAKDKPANNPVNPASRAPIIAKGIYKTKVLMRFNPVAVKGLFMALNAEAVKNVQPRRP